MLDTAEANAWSYKWLEEALISRTANNCLDYVLCPLVSEGRGYGSTPLPGCMKISSTLGFGCGHIMVELGCGLISYG